MGSTYGPVVPPGQSPPFAIVTPKDHAAWILIPTTLGLACFLFFGAIRGLVRWTTGHGFGVDDFVLYAANIMAVIQSAIILGACSKGLGKGLDLVSSEAQDQVQKMYYTSNLFFIMAIGLSKISVMCFLRRISRVRQHIIVFNLAIGFVVAWIFTSVLALALQCDLGHAWISVGEKCSGTFRRWQVICAFDIVTEVAIMCMVVFLVYSLKTPFSSKATVVGIFSCRLVNIIFIAYRLNTFDEAGYSTNPFILEAPFIAWTQGQMAYSLISATIPIFQNFLKSLHTGFGGITAAEGGYGYGSGNGSRNRGTTGNAISYHMSKLRSGNRSANKSAINNTALRSETYEERDAPPHAQTTNDNDRIFLGQSALNRSEIAANGETTSINSDESRQMMIRKEVEWNVRTEPRD